MIKINDNDYTILTVRDFDRDQNRNQAKGIQNAQIKDQLRTGQQGQQQPLGYKAGENNRLIGINKMGKPEPRFQPAQPTTAREVVRNSQANQKQAIDVLSGVKKGDYRG